MKLPIGLSPIGLPIVLAGLLMTASVASAQSQGEVIYHWRAGEVRRAYNDARRDVRRAMERARRQADRARFQARAEWRQFHRDFAREMREAARDARRAAREARRDYWRWRY